jgi:hypothetical protein
MVRRYAKGCGSGPGSESWRGGYSGYGKPVAAGVAELEVDEDEKEPPAGTDRGGLEEVRRERVL